jgi:hypothetical protein
MSSSNSESILGLLGTLKIRALRPLNCECHGEYQNLEIYLEMAELKCPGKFRAINILEKLSYVYP